MYNIGEKPGKDTHCCISCNWSAALDDASDPLRSVRQSPAHDLLPLPMIGSRGGAHAT